MSDPTYPQNLNGIIQVASDIISTVSGVGTTSFTINPLGYPANFGGIVGVLSDLNATTSGIEAGGGGGGTTDSVARASGNAALFDASVAQASGNAALFDAGVALASGNAALFDAGVALASGNAAFVDAGTALASGNAALVDAGVALASGNAAFVDAGTALASGNAALFDAGTALASGNAALFDAGTALASGNAALVDAGTALASGNAALVDAGTALASGNAALFFQTLSGLTDVDISTTAPIAGDSVVYNGASLFIPAEAYAATTRKEHLAHFDVTGNPPATDDGDDSLALSWVGGSPAATSSSVSATQSKFGGASLNVGGSGGGYNVTVGRTGTVFTFDCWVWAASVQTVNNFPRILRSPQYVLGLNTGSLGVYLDTFVNGNLDDEIWTGSSAYTANTWFHLAIQRVGFRYRMWLNGTHEGTITTANVVDGDNTFAIGHALEGNNLTGYLDEVRFTHTQQYADDGSNITVPTAPYT
jgi:hypothetical protein